jgi:hypothetical protein
VALRQSADLQFGGLVPAKDERGIGDRGVRDDEVEDDGVLGGELSEHFAVGGRDRVELGVRGIGQERRAFGSERGVVCETGRIEQRDERGIVDGARLPAAGGENRLGFLGAGKGTLAPTESNGVSQRCPQFADRPVAGSGEVIERRFGDLAGRKLVCHGWADRVLRRALDCAAGAGR